MPNEKNPYTLQQAPDMPDLSVGAFLNETGRADNWWNQNWFSNSKVKAEWESQKMATYQNLVNAVNLNNENYYNWLETYPGQREMLETAGYNPNLLSPGSAGSAGYNPITAASPAHLSNGDTDTFLGPITGIMEALGFFMNLKQQNAAIEGQSLKNVQTAESTKNQEIINKYLGEFLRGRNTGQGYDNTRKSYDLSVLFSNLFNDGNLPNYEVMYNDSTNGSTFGYGKAYLNDPDYRLKMQNLSQLESLVRLRNAEVSLKNMDTSIQKYYHENIQPMTLDILTGQKELQDIQKEIQTFIKNHQEADRVFRLVQDSVSSISSLLGDFLPVVKGAKMIHDFDVPVPYRP